MMSNLYIEEGGLIQLDSVSLPVATYTKFQPQGTEFLDITDPKAVYPYHVTCCCCFVVDPHLPDMLGGVHPCYEVAVISVL